MERLIASAPTVPVGRTPTRDIDRHVSSRIRQRRMLLGLTQQEMAGLISVSFQQAHKYEAGVNRISAGRLYQIAQALGVEINYFYRETEPGRDTQVQVKELAPQQRMLQELARSFALIKSREHQEALCRLTRELSRRDAVGKVPTSITHVLEDNGVTA
ncbi:MAG: helix-turn-helix domain-containing protein [Geminicoccales bacterium]